MECPQCTKNNPEGAKFCNECGSPMRAEHAEPEDCPAHEDDSVRAVRAAMEIHAAVENISPRFEQKIGRPLG